MFLLSKKLSAKCKSLHNLNFFGEKKKLSIFTLHADVNLFNLNASSVIQIYSTPSGRTQLNKSFHDRFLFMALAHRP